MNKIILIPKLPISFRVAQYVAVYLQNWVKTTPTRFQKDGPHDWWSTEPPSDRNQLCCREAQGSEEERPRGNSVHQPPHRSRPHPRPGGVYSVKSSVGISFKQSGRRSAGYLGKQSDNNGRWVAGAAWFFWRGAVVVVVKLGIRNRQLNTSTSHTRCVRRWR